MKRRLLLTILLTSSLTSLPMASSATELSSSGEEVIRIVDTRNRDLAGNFYDRTLEEKLLPSGSLGSLIERAISLPRSRRIVVIDPMLIEEVQDLANGFLIKGSQDGEGEEIVGSEIATNWLTRLNQAITGDEIAAINYGNPDLSFLSRSAPTELRIHARISQQRLAELLSRDVAEVTLLLDSDRRLANFLTENFTKNRRDIRAINRYAKNPETRRYRLINSSLIDPNFPRERAFQFARDLNTALRKYQNSIRITSGRYTLTSTKERVPVTLINDFNNDLDVRIRVSASNSRVIISEIDPITIAAKSKLQFNIPVEVLSSGQSDLIITITTAKGIEIGSEARLPLTLAVISPLTTWITTGSGLILLFAAIVQSVRRIRRSRKNVKVGVEEVINDE